MPRTITLLLVTCIVLIIGNAGSLWLNLSQLQRATAGVNQTWATIGKLRLLRSTLAIADSSHLSYLLTGDPRHARLAAESSRHFSMALQDVETELRLHPQLAARFADVRPKAADKLTEFSTTLALEQAGRHSEAVRLATASRSRATSAQVLDLLGQMIAQQHEHLTGLNQQALKRHRTAAAIGLVIGGITLAVAVFFYGLIKRNVRGWRVAEAALVEANQALEERIAARTAQLAGLSRHLIEVGEREKAALARELHDELGSNLTAINLDIAAVANQLKSQDPTAATRLTRALQVLKDTVELKRRLIQGLRPSMIDSLGLVPALRMCCEDFTRRTGLPCVIDLPDDLEMVDDDSAIALYRVVQEALTNIACHAQASQTTVRLTPGGDTLQLTIIDDGVGISAEAMNKPLAHGLLGMRERIARLGGSLSLQPGPAGGTVLAVRVPRRPHSRDSSPPTAPGSTVRV